MPAGAMDWHPFDGIFADESSFMGMYGEWRAGDYAIVHTATHQQHLVRIEWKDGDGVLVEVGSGRLIPYRSESADPVIKGRRVSLLEVLAWMSNGPGS